MSDQPPKRTNLFDEQGGDDDALAAAVRGDATLGEVLAHVRESQGLELAEVAQHLCIREPFLLAIERGDHAHLPGTAYGIGFVRSYADFLGLNGAEAVRLFKGEGDGDVETAELVFPEPMAESRIPRGAVLFISVLLAAAAYGGWYYLSSHDMEIGDLVPQVPATLGGPGDTAAGGAGTTAKPATEPAATAPDTAKTDMTKAETAPVGKAPEEKAPAEAAPAVAANAAPAAEQSVPEKPVAEKPVAEKPVAERAPAPAKPVEKMEKAEKAAKVPVAETAKPAARPVDKSLEKPAEKLAAKPAPAPSRSATQPETQTAVALPQIEIRAKADSWVQIRGPGGRVVMMRILRTGDKYAVPREKGLMLMTGNAGAIEITVDGQKVPAIGPFGAVRRDVALEGDRLKSGTAATP
jgi:cytoskeleton protein RodZ